MNDMDDIIRPGQQELLLPLAQMLGIGLTNLGHVLCPRFKAGGYRRLYVGGRTAYAPMPTWPLSALVVLAAEMAQAGEDHAFAGKVLAHPDVTPVCTAEELDQALRAVASVLLTNGWVTDLRDAEEGEV